VSYLVLARKYRPQTFADLVGQEHVALTLGNALESGRVAHAFLFTGVRGVGKTTSARILAKALNCLGPEGNATGPAREPCNRCAACLEIAQGSDLDVQEIDGASYNGVDEVRKLQEGLAFRPARDRFKIFIVDEVHMLSTAAWNAFLKTLEEPPPHVKFIFATTEVHKVPITILSRCQRYDFKLISAATVGHRLETVLAAENIEAEAGAVAILAREASGSMRDAMSLLDQVVAYAGTNLREADVARVLGVADRTVLHELSNAVLEGKADVTLTIVNNLASEGYDVAQVCRDLLRHLRNLVVARVAGAGAKALLDLPDAELEDVKQVAARHDVDDLTRCYQGFSRSFDDIVRSPSARSALEMALIRLARRPPLLPLDDLLQRLGDLERRLGGAPSRGPGGPGRGPSPSSVAHVRNDFEGSASGSVAPPRLAIVDGGPFRGGFEGALATAPQPPLQSERPVLRAVESPKVEPPPPPRARPRGHDAWEAVVEELRRNAPAVAAIYEHAKYVNDSDDALVVAFAPGDFLTDRGMQGSSVRELEGVVRRVLGPNVAVELRLEEREGESLAHKGERERAERREEARRAITEDPGVRALVERFNATIRDVKPSS
jgi:DNA polymerase III subunit gamma/tau